MVLGVDIGASALKLAAADGGRLTYKRYLPGKPDVCAAISASGLDLGALSAVAVTGVGAESAQLSSLPSRVVRVAETEAIGAGGLALSGKKRVLVASLGTGTALVAADGESRVHLGGSGVGGGTLSGLALLLGLDGAEALCRLATDGDLCKTDLTVGDLFSGSETLDPRLTASNLAKIAPDATKADWCAGLANLVFQAVGTMALLAAHAVGAEAVTITGAAAQGAYAKSCFEKFQTVYGLDYIIPPDAECATALGAALSV